jgi:acyl-CoA reductase-like NAD-dependent aldehyde dehydrogenase
VWINDHGATRLDLRAPFGGMKQSGFGREQGIEGVRAFQDTRSIATLDPEVLASMAH